VAVARLKLIETQPTLGFTEEAQHPTAAWKNSG